MDYVGANIRQLAANSPDECCQFCYEESECVCFTYSPLGRTCFLKNSAEQPKASPGSTAGERGGMIPVEPIAPPRPSSKPVPPGSPPQSAPGGRAVSGGTIFSVVVCVLPVAYLISGMLWNRYQNEASGLDMLPNREFWGDFFTLVGEGFVMVWAKIRGR